MTADSRGGAVEPEASNRIEVAIIEDDRTMREGMAALVDGTSGYSCRARFHSIEAALRSPWPKTPQVILLDIGLPGISGSAGVGLLLERFPAAAILMCTVYEDQDRVVEALCNGACGYLLKRTPPAELLHAIREAVGGGAPMSPEIARQVVRIFRHAVAKPEVTTRLTERELELLKLLSEGLSYKACGERQGVSENTVRSAIRRIYEKLHVHSRSAAVTKALRQRLI